MCKFHLTGACTRGDACVFAHNTTELQRPPDFFCTRICKDMTANGECNDPDCRFGMSSVSWRTGTHTQQSSLAEVVRSTLHAFIASRFSSVARGRNQHVYVSQHRKPEDRDVVCVCPTLQEAVAVSVRVCRSLCARVCESECGRVCACAAVDLVGGTASGMRADARWLLGGRNVRSVEEFQTQRPMGY